MLDTVSVFDVIEQDDTQHRVASRRTLALAHNRIEQNLGLFLRTATSREDFYERLALCQEDFTGYVMSAAEETDHSTPEHIAAALIEHYEAVSRRNAQNASKKRWSDVRPVRTAAWPEPYGPPSPQRDAWEEEAYGAPGQGLPTQQPQGMGVIPPPAVDMNVIPNPQVDMANQNIVPPPDPRWASEGKQSAPLGSPWDAVQDQYAGSMPWERPNDGTTMPEDQSQVGVRYPEVRMQTGETWPASYQGPEVHGQQGEIMAPELTVPPQDWSQYGPKQGAHGDEMITCPECGGDGEDAGGKTCPKCNGRGKVADFGPSALDAIEGSARTAEEGNTGLGGPETPINKSQGPGPMPEMPGKVVRKDILKPIPERNKDELEEIGDIKHEKLPSGEGLDDSGFDPGGETSGPHTKTFEKGKQADPVTREKQSSAEGNPLVTLLEQQWPSPQAVEQAFQRI